MDEQGPRTTATYPEGVTEPALPTPAAPEVEVRRSRRRTRTVTAFREEGRVVVAIPARFTAAQEREWVETMLARLARTERRRRPSDAALSARAAELSRAHLDGLARPTSVAWVTTMSKRWGSATPATGEIRISHVLQGVPTWVLDGVLVHELTHLLEANHTPRFRELARRYPRQAEAEAFLAGISWARGRGIENENANESEAEVDQGLVID